VPALAGQYIVRPGKCYGKSVVNFEIALNLVWLTLGLLAFGNALRASRSEAGSPRRLKSFQVVGIALILAAIFPYISATDDILRVENYASRHAHAGEKAPLGSKSTPSDNLVRLYATIDSPLICRSTTLAVTFVFLTFVFLPVVGVVDRATPLRLGRSPPAFSAL
jgi:hypothetical protein